MKVLFLCGGRGRRMSPVTEDKFLLKFLGKTLLEHQLDVAVNAGLTEFLVVANEGNIERIERTLDGIRAEVILQERSGGMAEAVRSASRWLDDEVIVANPNDIIEVSGYRRLLDAYKGGAATSYLLAQEVEEYVPGGYLAVDESNRVLRIVEKPERGNEPSNLVNIVLHLHTECDRLVSQLENTRSEHDDVYECALSAFIGQGLRIQAVPYDGHWVAIKYPWHILHAVEHFLEGVGGWVSKSADISDAASVDGKVIIGDGVRILENAVVRGPVYIGPGTVIGNNSLVRAYSHIGADCVIGFGTEIKGSYVGDRTWAHMTYLGDSIVGDDCSFGAGTVTGNQRLDGKTIAVMADDQVIDTGLDKLGAIIGDNCRTGIHVGTMPGVSIGAGSVIFPHVNMTKSVETNSRVTGEGVVLRRNDTVDEKEMGCG